MLAQLGVLGLSNTPLSTNHDNISGGKFSFYVILQKAITAVRVLRKYCVFVLCSNLVLAKQLIITVVLATKLGLLLVYQTATNWHHELLASLCTTMYYQGPTSRLVYPEWGSCFGHKITSVKNWRHQCLVDIGVFITIWPLLEREDTSSERESFRSIF